MEFEIRALDEEVPIGTPCLSWDIVWHTDIGPSFYSDETFDSAKEAETFAAKLNAHPFQADQLAHWWLIQLKTL